MTTEPLDSDADAQRLADMAERYGPRPVEPARGR